MRADRWKSKRRLTGGISSANTDGVSGTGRAFPYIEAATKEDARKASIEQLTPMLTRTAERDHNESAYCSGSLPSNAGCRLCR